MNEDLGLCEMDDCEDAAVGVWWTKPVGPYGVSERLCAKHGKEAEQNFEMVKR